MFSRKSSTEQGSTDPAVQNGAVRQDGRYEGVRNDGTTPGTATGATGAHARPVPPDSERSDAAVPPAGAVRTDPADDDRTTTSRPVRDERNAAAPVRDERTTTAPETAHEKYGGVNTGAAFFGWLVAVAITILLSGIIGAVAAAVSDQADVTQNDAERAANTIGLVAAIVLVAVLALAYYTGGYVAGRMSRFDGGRQGLGRLGDGPARHAGRGGGGLDLRRRSTTCSTGSTCPASRSRPTRSAAAASSPRIVVIVVTALAAMAGGTVGRRYHVKVDRHLAADRLHAPRRTPCQSALQILW